MSNLLEIFSPGFLEASGDQTSRQGDWSPEAKEWGRGQRREGAGRGPGDPVAMLLATVGGRGCPAAKAKVILPCVMWGRNWLWEGA